VPMPESGRVRWCERRADPGLVPGRPGSRLRRTLQRRWPPPHCDRPLAVVRGERPRLGGGGPPAAAGWSASACEGSSDAREHANAAPRPDGHGPVPREPAARPLRGGAFRRLAPQGIGQAITDAELRRGASSTERTAEAARYLRLVALVVGGASCALAVVAAFAIRSCTARPFRGGGRRRCCSCSPERWPCSRVRLHLHDAGPRAARAAELGRGGGCGRHVGGLAALCPRWGLPGQPWCPRQAMRHVRHEHGVPAADRRCTALVPGRKDLHWLAGRMIRAAREKNLVVNDPAVNDPAAPHAG